MLWTGSYLEQPVHVTSSIFFLTVNTVYDIGERQYGCENGVENADENHVEAAENIDENLANDDGNNVGEHFENAENVDESLF